MRVERVLRRAEVEKIVGLSRSTIYAAMSRQLFPRPILIGVRAVGWRLKDIENWLETRVVSEGW